MIRSGSAWIPFASGICSSRSGRAATPLGNSTPHRKRPSMRVLLTGHAGYIGTVMSRILSQRGHDVFGLDSDLFIESTYGDAPVAIPARRKDIRCLLYTSPEPTRQAEISYA